MNQVSKPKIVIVGAGAVGSVIGGLLARDGQDVTLIARSAHVEVINKNGLIIDGEMGKFIINVQAKSELDFRPDIVLLAVKAQDVEAVCKQIKPYVIGVPVLMLQNGIRSDEMAASVLGDENIISCVVMFNARFINPGCVTYGVKGSLLIGETFRKNGKRVEYLASFLNSSIKTEVSDNISGVRWTKLLVNIVGNGLEAIAGISFGECMKHSEMRRIGIYILREGFNVAEKAGIKLVSLPNLPISAFRTTIRSPLPIASLVLGLTMGGTNTVTSTLQSIRKGKPTEINYLNGEIMKQGRKINLATPYNAKVVELVHNVERTGQFYSPSQIETLFRPPNKACT